jgi:hypothetical protein
VVVTGALAASAAKAGLMQMGMTPIAALSSIRFNIDLSPLCRGDRGAQDIRLRTISHKYGISRNECGVTFFLQRFYY